MVEPGNEDGEVLRREARLAVDLIGAECRRISIEEQANGDWKVTLIVVNPSLVFGLASPLTFSVSKHATPKDCQNLVMYVIGGWRAAMQNLKLFLPISFLYNILAAQIYFNLAEGTVPLDTWTLATQGFFLLVCIPVILLSNQRKARIMWKRLIPQLGGIEKAYEFAEFCQQENKGRPFYRRFFVHRKALDQAANELSSKTPLP